MTWTRALFSAGRRVRHRTPRRTWLQRGSQARRANRSSAVIGGQPVGRVLGGQLLQEDPVKEPQVLVPVPYEDAELPFGDLGERPRHAGRGLGVHG